MPSAQTIPFHLPGFTIDQVEEHGQLLIVRAHSIAESGVCPDCGYPSQSVHSTYHRSPRDLPCDDHKLRLDLQVHRFRCQNSNCFRRTFVERMPQLVPVHGQRTHRLTNALRALAFELNSEAAARVTQHFRMPVSGDTLLRVIRDTAEPVFLSPRVLGVDDWAFKKGRRYGTILIDLERHSPIDLLPDREAQTLANWLRVHPSIEIISRDRAGTYAEGAACGAPQAIQVADRWHLLKNLCDALALTYDCHHALLRQIRVEQPQQTSSENKSKAFQPDNSCHRKSSAQQQARRQRRDYWQAKLQEVHALRDQGLSKRAIARQTGLSRKTVGKYCCLPELPKKTSPKSGPHLIDPYRDYLQERLQADNPSTHQLWQEIRLQGFPGGHTTVYMCVAQLRHELGLLPPRRKYATTPQPQTKPLTARTLVALVLARPDDLSDEKQGLITRARQLHPDLLLATQLAQDFATMLRTRDDRQFDSWLQNALTSDIPALVGFASGLQRDYAAVKAAFRLPWSNGQVEGQVNRLKCIKRQMYGRANFDLLRLRVLHPL